MLNSEWFTVIILTYLLLVGCGLALIISLKWYRPAIKLGKSISILLVVMVILGLSSIDLLKGGQSAKLPSLTKEELLYKQLYWQQHENSDFALSQAIKLWGQNPEPAFKLALALAYVDAEEWQRGSLILDEVLQHKNKASKLYIETDQLNAYTSQLKQLHSSITDENAISIKQEIKAENTKIVTQMKEELSGKLEETEEQSLVIMAKLDSDRLHYLYHASAQIEQREELQQEAEQLYDQVILQLQEAREQRRSSSSDLTTSLSLPQFSWIATAEASEIHSEMSSMSDELYIKLAGEVAKTAIYYQDQQDAKQLLLDVLQEHPLATEPATMLSEMLLNKQVDLNEEELQQLGVYAEANMEQQRQQQAMLSNWSTQVIEADEQAAELLQQQLEEIAQQTVVETFVAHSLLKKLNEEDNPNVNVLLSQYYFQTQNEEKASQELEKIQENTANLSVAQQYYVQQLQSLPAEQEMTIEDFEQRNYLTNQIYTSFSSLGGQRVYETDMTESERAFAVYMSNELISFNRSAIRISSIQADEGGDVELYFAARNMKDVTKDTLSVQDNAIDIDSFKLEQLNKASSFERNIVLLTDVSGSMQGDRIEGAKQGLHNFVNSIKNNERVGLVTFSSEAMINQSLSESLTGLSSSIDQLEAGGDTNITSAFNTGLSLLESASGERILFILSDGEDSTFSQNEVRQQIINRARDAGVTVFAIGFASGYETLRDVADGTGGQYIAVSGIDSLLSSFDQIRETIESTYRVTYQLNPMEQGQHLVKLTDNSGKFTTKSYTIGGKEAENEATDSIGHSQETLEDMTFGISNVTPNRIIHTVTGTTKLKITGVGFDQLDKLLLDGKEQKFKKRSSTELELEVKNSLPVGSHKLTAQAKNQAEDTFNLSVTYSAEQDFRWFGDAKVYGDFIEDKGGVSTLQGNTSVDRFIYDVPGKMVLKDEESLKFSGMMLDVDSTKMNIVAQKFLQSSNKLEASEPLEIEMTVESNEKDFKIEPQGVIKAIADKSSLGMFGLQVNLVPSFAYEARAHNDDGKLVATAGIGGFSSITGLSDRLTEQWTRTLKFLPTNARITLEYEKESFTVAGKVSASINLGTLMETGDLSLSVAYEHAKSKLDLGLETEDAIFKGRALNFSLNSWPINRFGVHVGFQGSFLPKAGEILLGSAKGVPLGTSPLSMRMINVGLDFRGGFGVKLGTEIGTLVDGPAQRVITLANRLPGIDISPDACVICVSGEADVKEVPDNWKVKGGLSLTVLGFEAASASTYIDAHEISGKISAGLFEGNAKLIFNNERYQKKATLLQEGKISGLGVSGSATMFFIPDDFKKSYVEMEYDGWVANPSIRIEAEDVMIFS